MNATTRNATVDGSEVGLIISDPAAFEAITGISAEAATDMAHDYRREQRLNRCGFDASQSDRTVWSNVRGLGPDGKVRRADGSIDHVATREVERGWHD